MDQKTFEKYWLHIAGAYSTVILLYLIFAEWTNRKHPLLAPIGIVILAPFPCAFILWGILGIKDGRITIKGHENTGLSAYLMSIFVILVGIFVFAMLLQLLFWMLTGRPFIWCENNVCSLTSP